MRPVIVKLGGSVITEKSGRFRVRRGVLRRIAKEIAECGEELVVVHGGGSFGHPIAREHRLAEGFTSEKQLFGFAQTHAAMVELNREVVGALLAQGLPAVPVEPLACVITSGGRIARAELGPVRRMLQIGLLPVLFGDVVLDLKKGFTVLSGDQLVSFLAVRLRAKRVVVGADVDGVFTSDPKSDPNARLLREVTPADLQKMRFGTSTVDVTGGMAGKLFELFSPAGRGIPVQIVNAAKPGILARAIRGEAVLGTVVRAR